VTDVEIEAALMDKLYTAVKGMFGYTGWDDCDKDAAEAVRKVESALEMVKNWRKLRADIAPKSNQIDPDSLECICGAYIKDGCPRHEYVKQFRGSF
jgi:hypothetical protein